MTELTIDTTVPGLPDFSDEHVAAADDLGIDCLWSEETAHNAFAPLPVTAQATTDVQFGTRIATAFTRSPMVTAKLAWDLQSFSGGRFILGLGTQVEAHNERRFSVDFDWRSPGPRIREVIESIRHIWDVFQGRTDELDYQGEFYQFSLMADMFDPGPIAEPDIPIYIAAVNDYNLRLAGELCDGLCLHALNSPSYTREVVAPVVREGAERSDRTSAAVDISISPFVITGRNTTERERQREEVREQIAFYASTPTYKDVMDHHGWVSIGSELHGLAREQRWDEMVDLVTDEMVETFAITAPPAELGPTIADQYGDVIDRVLPMLNFDPETYWDEIVASFEE